MNKNGELGIQRKKSISDVIPLLLVSVHSISIAIIETFLAALKNRG
jgi:hypothetical protein